MSAIIERLEPTERQLTSVLGRTSPLVKLAIALVWLIGLALTTKLLPPAFITIVVLVVGNGSAASRARSSSPASRHCGSPRSASACSTPCSRAPTRTRRCRSRSCSARSTSPGRRSRRAPGSRRGSSPSRRSAWCSARRRTRRGSWTRSSSRRGSRSGSATARWRPTRRSRGSTTSSRRSARRGGSAGCDGAGTRDCSSGCWCSRSATAIAWRSRWTRGRSGRAAVALPRGALVVAGPRGLDRGVRRARGRPAPGLTRPAPSWNAGVHCDGSQASWNVGRSNVGREVRDRLSERLAIRTTPSCAAVNVTRSTVGRARRERTRRAIIASSDRRATDEVAAWPTAGRSCSFPRAPTGRPTTARASGTCCAGAATGSCSSSRSRSPATSRPRASRSG